MFCRAFSVTDSRLFAHSTREGQDDQCGQLMPIKLAVSVQFRSYDGKLAQRELALDHEVPRLFGDVQGCHFQTVSNLASAEFSLDRRVHMMTVRENNYNLFLFLFTQRHY